MEEQSRSRLHPLMATAAIGVIVLCLVAVAAMTGYLPGSSAQKSEPQAVAPAPALAAAPAPANVARPAPQASAQKHRTQIASAPPPPPAQAAPRCADCGVVQDVKEVNVKGQGTGLGAVAGGVVGAVVGNQFGGGDGRKIMTVAGAAGGALAGNEIEKQARAQKHFDVAVLMNDGSTRTVSMEAQPTWRSGDRVRVVNGRIEPMQ